MTGSTGSTGPASPDLVAELQQALGDPARVHTRELDRRVMAHDASHFLLHPQAVVTPTSADEVGRLLQASARTGIPLTFRSGGTSLSGQGVTDGVLADVRKHFREVEVLDDGARVCVQPGVTVRQLNARLAPYGRKFGPDPASESACTIGGVVANNSSGMACGTVENSYRTLESVVAVLPSGTVVDTGARDADELLRTLEPTLYAGLLALRDRVRSDPGSVAKIQQQFSMKNTMGYGVNAFLDHDTASELLTHLLVGSEGTLAFVASATFRTIPLRAYAASALLVFPDLFAANHELAGLVATGAATLELMDATSLRVGQALVDCPAQIQALTVDRQAALLLEYQATSADDLLEQTDAAAAVLGALPTTAPAVLTRDARERAALWKLRKGLYTSVAGARPAGTTALLEDVVVPVPALADTCVELTRLFDAHGYSDGVIFGHAKDGNIHFMLTDRFESDDQLRRYSEFTEAMVDLVLGNDGSLKAEHGTGRVMAPYVRRQFGDELYDVMREVKRLCDPAGLLNPGVLLDDDPDAHLKHIKLAPRVEEEVDRCVECGYCEPVCPSKDLTITPRQRIVGRRELAAARAAGDTELVASLEQDYDYAGIETCAVDGMCVTACPVLINTGDLVRRLRREDRSRVEAAGWKQAAKHWGAATKAGSLGLSTAARLPDALLPAVAAANQAVRGVAGTDRVPLYSPELPGGGARRHRPPPVGIPDAVYLPSCVNVMFGPADGSPGVQVSFEKLCAAAGLTLEVPQGIDGLCCGTPWSSKGQPEGYAVMRDRVLRTIAGAKVVVSDAASCTEGFAKIVHSALAQGARGDLPEVVDVVTYVAREVLPRLQTADPAMSTRRLASLTLHPTCSSVQLGLDADLAAVGAAVAETVTVPTDWGCCGFAGDRGMLHPELTASATAREAAEVERLDADGHASCNRTCELGMTRATGRDYRHVVELLADVVGGD